MPRPFDNRTPLPYIAAAALVCETDKTYPSLTKVLVRISAERQAIVATDGKGLVRYEWAATDGLLPFDGLDGDYLMDPRSIAKGLKGARGPLSFVERDGVASLCSSDGRTVVVERVKDGVHGWWRSYESALRVQMFDTPEPPTIHGMDAHYLGLLPRLLFPVRTGSTASKLIPCNRGWRFAPVHENWLPCKVDVLLMPIRLAEGTDMEAHGVRIVETRKSAV